MTQREFRIATSAPWRNCSTSTLQLMTGGRTYSDSPNLISTLSRYRSLSDGQDEQDEEVLKKTMGQSAQVIFLSRQLN